MRREKRPGKRRVHPHHPAADRRAARPRLFRARFRNLRHVWPPARLGSTDGRKASRALHPGIHRAVAVHRVIFGFLGRDGVAATGMGLLSGFWAVLALVTITGKPGSTSHALGLFLLVAGVAMWAPASSASKTKIVPALVLATAGLRFAITGIYQLTSNETWENTAGVIGLVLAALAVYAAYAAEFEDVLDRPVLPLGRRGKGKQATKGTYIDQIIDVANEPGVRQQL